jgi:hypothetical protein
MPAEIEALFSLTCDEFERAWIHNLKIGNEYSKSFS